MDLTNQYNTYAFNGHKSVVRAAVGNSSLGGVKQHGVRAVTWAGLSVLVDYLGWSRGPNTGVCLCLP